MELRAESGANPARWIRRESGALDPARIRRAGSGANPARWIRRESDTFGF